MIFVTIGSTPFLRLIEKMDEIAGKLDEKIVMQIGYTKYKPRNAEYFDFKSYQEIKELCRKSKVVVCHGGIGSIITALETETPVITFPRKKEYGETPDDHDFETIEALLKEGLVKVVYNLDELEDALKKIDVCSIKVKSDKKLVNALKDCLTHLDKSSKKG